jgi:large subunit ribosomal protein L15
VNLWRIQQAIDAGKLDAKAAIDAKASCEGRRHPSRSRTACACSAAGELTTKLNLKVCRPRPARLAAIEVEKAARSAALCSSQRQDRSLTKKSAPLGKTPRLQG